jgi:hypothetical protein
MKFVNRIEDGGLKITRDIHSNARCDACRGQGQDAQQEERFWVRLAFHCVKLRLAHATMMAGRAPVR